jgi:hypothetical protein
MTNETKKRVIAELMRKKVEIERSLEASVLDGTPYLLIAPFDGREMFYCGEQKFRPLEILDWHCCGAILMSPESATKAVDRLKANGRLARMLHQREHARNILKETETYIKNLTEGLGA